MTETNVYILDPEKLNYLIETLRYCQGAFERELQGLDHFLQGTKLEMEHHVRHIEEKKKQAEADKKQAEADLKRAELQKSYAEEDLKKKETQVEDADDYVTYMNKKLNNAYDNLNYQKQSMSGRYHPEYNSVINDCWNVINDTKKGVNNAHTALNEAKNAKGQASRALKAAEQSVSSCTAKRERANSIVEKWTSRLPEAKELFIEVRRLLEDNYYAAPSVFDNGGPDWKMTLIVTDKIPQAIKKIQEIIKAIEAYLGTSVSSMEPFIVGMPKEDGEGIPSPMTDKILDETVQDISDSIYADIRNGFKPDPKPVKENVEIRCRTCGRRLNECRCKTIVLS